MCTCHAIARERQNPSFWASTTFHVAWPDASVCVTQYRRGGKELPINSALDRLADSLIILTPATNQITPHLPVDDI